MSKFHTLVVDDIREETADCVSVSLKIPEEKKQIFKFIHGQHVTLKKLLNGTDVRRSYSICSSPHENELRVAIKKVPGGIFSTYANESLKPGDTLDVFPPDGHFYTMPKTGIQNIYVGFAAGSGITPVISIIKTLLSEEPMCNFILFYSNSAVESIIFREELEGIKSKYMDRFSMHYLLTREELESPLFSGRIDPKKIQAFSTLFFQPEEVEAYFLCGPEPMIFSTKETLEQLNVNQDKIHFELFTTPSSKRYETGKTDSITEIDPLTESHVRIILDGDRLEYTLPYTGTNILDSALNAGADVPFSCKGGVCCTCKAKLMEGQVHMDVAWGLEPDEIADGYILTCQSHPRSEKLLVNFDLR